MRAHAGASQIPAGNRAITVSGQVLKAGGELDAELIALFTWHSRFDRHTDAGAEAYVLG